MFQFRWSSNLLKLERFNGLPDNDWFVKRATFMILYETIQAYFDSNIWTKETSGIPSAFQMFSSWSPSVLGSVGNGQQGQQVAQDAGGGHHDGPDPRRKGETSRNIFRKAVIWN